MRLGIPLCLALAGCATATQPAHPLMGMWVGQKSLVLDVSTYSYGEEHGDWTGGGRTFRYKRSGSSGLQRNAASRCGVASSRYPGVDLLGDIVDPSSKSTVPDLLPPSFPSPKAKATVLLSACGMQHRT